MNNITNNTTNITNINYIFTADVTSELHDKLLNSGFTEFIYKPDDVNKIISVFRKSQGDKEDIHNNNDTENTDNNDIENTNNETEINRLKYKDLNIIIVDNNEGDSIIFQKVIEKIARDLDITINYSIFTNGKEVSDYYMSLDDNNNVDCIFMDIEMPIMNGYRATMLIRSKDKHIPIIGVSSNELEASYSNLFTHKLIKPVKEINIKNHIMVLLNNQNKDIIDKYIDTTITSGFKELGKDVVSPIVKQWNSNVEENIKQMQESLNKENYDNVKFLAHFMKGSSYQIGCSKFGQLLKNIEEASSEKNKDLCVQLIDSATECLVNTRKYLEEEYNWN